MATFVPDTLRLVANGELMGMITLGHFEGDLVHPLYTVERAMLEFTKLDRQELLRSYADGEAHSHHDG